MKKEPYGTTMLTVGSEMVPRRSRFISLCFSMSGTRSTVMLLAWHVKQQTDAVTLGKLRTPNLRIQSGYGNKIDLEISRKPDGF
jgi:hypothetical protein